MKCFYHGTDMDGKCAAAIVNKYYREAEEKAFYGINYNNDFPFEIIKKDELIIIVDFSLQKEGEFQKLLEITKNIIWIDHHKTAIERHKDMSHLRGIRNINKSGCELTWEYFYPNKMIPRIVKLLGDYDTWTFAYGDDSNYLQQGIRLNDTKPTNINWDKWLGESSDEYSKKIIKDGKICIQYRDNYYYSLVEAWSFPVEFEGYKCIACNAGSVSSQLFDGIEDIDVKYDIRITFVFDSKQWTVSLYSKIVDVSEIAKKYGGGGHEEAAGFQCNELPFIPKEKE